MPNPPEHKKFTPRDATKYVATALVRMKASKLTKNVVTDYTNFDEDDKVVELAGYLVGWYVGDKLRPITDKMVDKTANFITTKREEMKAEKPQKDTENEQ